MQNVYVLLNDVLRADFKRHNLVTQALIETLFEAKDYAQFQRLIEFLTTNNNPMTAGAESARLKREYWLAVTQLLVLVEAEPNQYAKNTLKVMLAAAMELDKQHQIELYQAVTNLLQHPQDEKALQQFANWNKSLFERAERATTTFKEKLKNKPQDFEKEMRAAKTHDLLMKAVRLCGKVMILSILGAFLAPSIAAFAGFLLIAAAFLAVALIIRLATVIIEKINSLDLPYDQNIYIDASEHVHNKQQEYEDSKVQQENSVKLSHALLNVGMMAVPRVVADEKEEVVVDGAPEKNCIIL